MGTALLLWLLQPPPPPVTLILILMLPRPRRPSRPVASDGDGERCLRILIPILTVGVL